MRQETAAEQVTRLAATLPEEYRIVVQLCDLQHLTYAEAAREAGLTLDEVKTRLQHGRQLLKRKKGRKAPRWCFISQLTREDRPPGPSVRYEVQILDHHLRAKILVQFGDDETLLLAQQVSRCVEPAVELRVAREADSVTVFAHRLPRVVLERAKERTPGDGTYVDHTGRVEDYPWLAA